MEEEVLKRNRNTTFTKQSWKHIKKELYTLVKRSYTNLQLRNKYNLLRQKHKDFKSLLKETGIGYSEVTEQVSAPEEVWDGLIQVNKSAKIFRKKSCVLYKKSCTIFGDTTVTGSNAHPSTRSPSIDLDNNDDDDDDDDDTMSKSPSVRNQESSFDEDGSKRRDKSTGTTTLNQIDGISGEVYAKAIEKFESESEEMQILETDQRFASFNPIQIARDSAIFIERQPGIKIVSASTTAPKWSRIITPKPQPGCPTISEASVLIMKDEGLLRTPILHDKEEIRGFTNVRREKMEKTEVLPNCLSLGTIPESMTNVFNKSITLITDRLVRTFSHLRITKSKLVTASHCILTIRNEAPTNDILSLPIWVYSQHPREVFMVKPATPFFNSSVPESPILGEETIPLSVPTSLGVPAGIGREGLPLKEPESQPAPTVLFNKIGVSQESVSQTP
ncbi:hypothetical protein F8388_018885 [Cannabis sativa]|uniref:Myb/SANT-like domain-containing protein n=1 Tax=Cannabis sativa TaxID=3483 RepID=A0A7J6FZQ0_CANSA|nr:hypothetical protein F8388_018885 [Cannabis sativa]